LLRGGDVVSLRGVEEALRLGDPASKCVSCGVLVLPGEGSHMHALLGGGYLGLGGRKSRNKGAVGDGDSGGTRRRALEEGGG
jgi:hypothetical protein